MWLEVLNKTLVKRLSQVFNFEKETMETELSTQEEIQESKSEQTHFQDTWPGPDQWYKGPFEIFEECEEGSS